MRVVCRRCARIIDLREGRLEIVENLKLSLALLVLIGLALSFCLAR